MNQKERKEKEQEKEFCLSKLKELLKPGDTVYTVLRHVSSSGMNRSISLLIGGNKNIVDISYYAAQLVGSKLDDKHGGIKIGGRGMDMGFALVYNLSRALFPDGFKPREAGRNYGRNGASPDKIDPDGGYSLNQKWI